MVIQIHKAVLHILDSTVGVPVFSEKDLDLNLETENFLEKHLTKIFKDDGTKDAFFHEGANKIRELCEQLAQNEDFMAISTQIATDLYQLMVSQAAIPPADLICCLFDADGIPYYGVLKLNYKFNFIHYVQPEEELNAITLIQQRTVLPSESQRLEECFLVNLNDYTIKLIEKEYEIDGTKEYYLSKLFLNCHFNLSTREKARLINKVTQQVSKKYCEDKVAPLARLRKTVTADMDENGTVNLDRVAQTVFHDNPTAQQEYLEELHQVGLVEPEVKLSTPITDKKFRNHKIQTDTGIEIKFPADYYNDQGKLEFINNADGTISILIKNIGKLTNK